MNNRRRLLLKLRLMKLRRKAFMLFSQLYGNQRMYRPGLNWDRLFRGEFALRVTEMMNRTDPEEFFGYFRMDRTVFWGNFSIDASIYYSRNNAQKPHLTGRTAGHHTEVVSFLFFHQYQNAFVQDLVFQIAWFFWTMSINIPLSSLLHLLITRFSSFGFSFLFFRFFSLLPIRTNGSTRSSETRKIRNNETFNGRMKWQVTKCQQSLLPRCLAANRRGSR